MHSYIRNALKQMSVDNSELHYSSEALIKLILSTAVVPGVKSQLVIALENILYVDSERGAEGGSLVQKYAEQCFVILQGLSIEGSQAVDINGILLVISTLFKNASDGLVIMQMFSGMSSPLSTLVSTILIQVLQQLLDRTSGTDTFIHMPRSEYQAVDMLPIDQKLHIVRTWAVIHFEMLKKYKSLKVKKGLKLIAGSDEYGRLFSSVLKFFVPPQTQEAMQRMTEGGLLSDLESTLLTQCGLNEIDLLINEIRSKVLSSLKIIWTYLFTKKPKDIYSTANIYV